MFGLSLLLNHILREGNRVERKALQYHKMKHGAMGGFLWIGIIAMDHGGTAVHGAGGVAVHGVGGAVSFRVRLARPAQQDLPGLGALLVRQALPERLAQREPLVRPERLGVSALPARPGRRVLQARRAIWARPAVQGRLERLVLLVPPAPRDQRARRAIWGRPVVQGRSEPSVLLVPPGRFI